MHTHTHTYTCTHTHHYHHQTRMRPFIHSSYVIRPLKLTDVGFAVRSLWFVIYCVCKGHYEIIVFTAWIHPFKLTKRKQVNSVEQSLELIMAGCRVLSCCCCCQNTGRTALLSLRNPLKKRSFLFSWAQPWEVWYSKLQVVCLHYKCSSGRLFFFLQETVWNMAFFFQWEKFLCFYC